MRVHFHSIFIVVLISAVAASSAFAQPRQVSAEQRVQRLKEALALTEKQTVKVKEILLQMESDRKKALESAPGDPESRMEMMRSLNEKADKKIEAMLTPEQKKKFQEFKQQRQQRREGGGGR